MKRHRHRRWYDRPRWRWAVAGATITWTAFSGAVGHVVYRWLVGDVLCK